MRREKPFRARKVTRDCFAVVIRAFQASPKFQALALSTRVSYGHTFRLAERPDTLGALSVEEIRPALVQAFLDGFADRPGQQRCAQTALKSLEKWALVRDLLPYPITTGTEAPGGRGSHEPWNDEHVRLAEQHARRDLAQLVTLAANTGQRGSDLVKMRWADIEAYKGHPGINVVQRKTGKTLWVPMTPELTAAVRTWERRPGFIVVKPDGQPYTRPQLSDNWLKERDANGALESLRPLGLSFHGLRATAVIRLRRLGISKPLIADFVGMSGLMVDRYCRRSEQRDNALAAMRQIEGTAQEPAVVVPFKTSQ
jgi:integrase